MKVFRKKRPAAEISRSEAMHCIPVKSREVQETRGESGQVLLSYPVALRPWIARWIRRGGGAAASIGTKKLQLDALGTVVWDLLDGKRSVEQIIQCFVAIQQLHPKESELSVSLFLRQLGKRGLIGMR